MTGYERERAELIEFGRSLKKPPEKQVLPGVIGRIVKNHGGHCFGPDLTCINRRAVGYELIWRWKHYKPYQRGLYCTRRAVRGEICGKHWLDHNETPSICSTNVAEFGDTPLRTRYSVPTDRAGRWGSLLVASRVPKSGREE